MVRQEVISFIQEQIAIGRDVRTIRNYLLSRGLEEKDVDVAFDIVFRTVEGTKPSVKSYLGKLVVGGGVVVLILIIIFALTLYNNLIPEENPPVRSSQENLNSPEITQTSPSLDCSLENSEDKYECYVALFRQGDFYCYEIEDSEERDFCFRAKDLYVLNA